MSFIIKETLILEEENLKAATRKTREAKIEDNEEVAGTNLSPSTKFTISMIIMLPFVTIGLTKVT